MRLAAVPDAPTDLSALAAVRRDIESHAIYRSIETLPALRTFMEAHVFAVWDFMSLLKALQARLTGITLPWVPPASPRACRLINEIVLGEESDADGAGGYGSHFELYLRAMREAGADVRPIEGVLTRVGAGEGVGEALRAEGVPGPVRAFVSQTFAVIERGRLHELAAAFTLGREDLIPAMFRRFLASGAAPGDRYPSLYYYLARHVEVDGDEHGPLALALLDELTGGDPRRQHEAAAAAEASLRARLALWDHVTASIAAGR